jgi:hypothetical protein
MLIDMAKILAIDPGSKSGWALWDCDDLVASGEIYMGSLISATRLYDCIADARPDLCAIEGPYNPRGKGLSWKMLWGLGLAVGRWVQVCMGQNVSTVIVPPREWMQYVFNGRIPKDPKRLYVPIAAKVKGAPVGDDEAAAILIGRYVITKNKKEKV